MIPKQISGSYAKCLILLTILMPDSRCDLVIPGGGDYCASALAGAQEMSELARTLALILMCPPGTGAVSDAALERFRATK